MDPSHPPVPSYRLSLTQLDGVRCAVDTTMFESEKSELRDSNLEEVQVGTIWRIGYEVMVNAIMCDVIMMSHVIMNDVMMM